MVKSRLEVTFRLLDGRKVTVGRTRDDRYCIRVFETVYKKHQAKVYEEFTPVIEEYDGKIATFQQIMTTYLSKTLYVTGGAKDVCVRLLD